MKIIFSLILCLLLFGFCSSMAQDIQIKGQLLQQKTVVRFQVCM